MVTYIEMTEFIFGTCYMLFFFATISPPPTHPIPSLGFIPDSLRDHSCQTGVLGIEQGWVQFASKANVLPIVSLFCPLVLWPMFPAIFFKSGTPVLPL